MDDTIAAISTPPGEGGIGIIRISGEDSLSILKQIFRTPSGKQNMKDHLLVYGHIIDPEDGKMIDEVLSVYMKAPRTYTAEDVVEIDCHGGIVPLRKILQLVYRCGARPAERGEFTERAFLNGRLDLSQAEAVMDMISARADKTYDSAVGQLSGSLSGKIKEIRSMLMDIRVQVTVNIEYPDEDIEIMTYQKMKDDLKPVIGKISELLKTAETGRILSSGLKIAIVGKPNVGKSSLMNQMLRESRAIVTDIPGTTRDTIREDMRLRGIPISLIDTAGIRETDDQIEAIGIEKSRDSWSEADLVLLVLDAGSPLSGEDREILRQAEAEKTIVVLNKTDLPQQITAEDVNRLLPGVQLISASMKEGNGLDAIEDSIEQRVYQGTVTADQNVIVTNARHKQLLEEAGSHLNDALRLADRKEPLEIIDLDLEAAYENLGEIIGDAVGDDVISEVFSRFCLGK
ncbi:MAG: tRNA uridine-5-carboxymethylaminomethyl(34) synthesis GTPase MnmE [Eubacterium sp.]|jgi:tRNA modification GTPase|nr:tRNA uridine-5-carboxymethylaminomethyl(34) synthesis GTPase MnmE [Eubacterium sp.]MCI2196935.1 tRNA uridine-5-carboxymethylaminomethyl(34) synthesis GTPase MnmE [Eubacterium sp.]